MVLPAFASTDDLSARLPGGLSDDDLTRAEAALSDASALIRAEAGKTWVDDLLALSGVPDVVVSITIAAARRALTNPDGVTSESVQDYSRAFAATSASADIYLTRGEKSLVRRAAGGTGLWTLSTTRSDVGGDVPAVVSSYAIVGSNADEEVDPFSEGWTG